MVTEARLWLSMKCAIAEKKRENCRNHYDSYTEQKDPTRGKREEHPRWFVYLISVYDSMFFVLV